MALQGLRYELAPSQDGLSATVTITRLDGTRASMELPTTEARIRAWLTLGQLIQKALPELSSEEREFLISGMTPAEWAEMFPPEDE